MRESGPRRRRPGRAGGGLVRTARNHPLASLLIVALLAAGSYALWSGLHRTEADLVKAVIRAARDAVVAGQASRLMEHVSPYFSAEGLKRDDLSSLLERALSRRPILRTRLTLTRIEMRGPSADAYVRARAFHPGPWGNRWSVSEWQLRLERLGDGWFISYARPLTVDGHRQRGLRPLLGLAAAGP